MRNASCFNRRRYSQSNCQSLDGELSPSSVRWLWESPREKAPLGQRRAAPRRLLAFWLLEQLRESLGSSGRRSAVDTRCMNGVAEPFLNWHYSHLYHRRRVKGPSSGASAALLWTVTFVPEWNFDSVLFFFFFCLVIFVFVYWLCFLECVLSAPTRCLLTFTHLRGTGSDVLLANHRGERWHLEPEDGVNESPVRPFRINPSASRMYAKK